VSYNVIAKLSVVFDNILEGWGGA